MVIDDNKAKPIYVGDNYYYQDSVTIVNRGFKIFYQKILTLLTCLDLSNNNFHGRILDEVQDLNAGNYYKSLYVSTISKREENCALRNLVFDCHGVATLVMKTEL
ncbi:hypothetical protein GOBAR_DD19982 [Gossypium barbadense]|nr:hypothetical protein GOBAR_DD19982 [Gossypium barbadense]